MKDTWVDALLSLVLIVVLTFVVDWYFFDNGLMNNMKYSAGFGGSDVTSTSPSTERPEDQDPPTTAHPNDQGPPTTVPPNDQGPSTTASPNDRDPPNTSQSEDRISLITQRKPINRGTLVDDEDEDITPIEGSG